MLAHEVGHVRNRDVRLMSIAAVMVGVIALAADMLMRITIWGGDRTAGSGVVGVVAGLIAAVLAPIGAAMLQMSLSRRREYLADAAAVEFTGDAEGLARALAALRDDHQPLKHVTRATAHLYIESPLRDHKGLRSSLGGMFDTHPPLEDRIAKLEQIGGFTLPPAGRPRRAEQHREPPVTGADGRAPTGTDSVNRVTHSRFARAGRRPRHRARHRARHRPGVPDPAEAVTPVQQPPHAR